MVDKNNQNTIISKSDLYILKPSPNKDSMTIHRNEICMWIIKNINFKKYFLTSTTCNLV